MIGRQWCVAVLCALALGACSSAAPDVREQFVTSGRVHYASVEGHPACAGSSAWLDDVLARQAVFLGLGVPAGVTYHYRPIPTPFSCPPGASGCTSWGSAEIYARPPDLTHELVHAILGRNLENPPAAFLDEGVAVALGGADLRGEPADYATSLDPLLEANPLPLEAFPLAGDLTSYLIQSRGAQRFVDLLRQTTRGQGAASIRSLIQAEYGKSLDELITERQAATLKFDGHRLAIPECTLTPAAAPPDRLEVAASVDCGSSSYGPLIDRDPPTAESVRVLDVPNTAFYVVDAVSSSGAANLGDCAANDSRLTVIADMVPPRAHQITFARLSAGRHWLELRAPVSEAASFLVALRSTSAGASGCAAVPPESISDDTDALWFTGDGADAYFSISTTAATEWRSSIASSTLARCPTCESCIDVGPGEDVHLEAGVPHIFRVNGLHAGLTRR